MTSSIPENGTAVTADVVVVIVNWNSGKMLERCLSCLQAGTVAPREIIVVDNGSDDASFQCVNERFPKANLVRLDKDYGYAVAANFALKAANGCEWVAALNPDAFPEPDWLEALLRSARANPEFASFGSHMISDSEPNVMDGIGDIFHVSGRIRRQHHGAPATRTSGKPKEIFSPCGAGALYRIDTIRQAGAFDDDFFCYVEDIDLGFRLRLQGQRCLYVPDAVLHHVGGASTGKLSDFSIYHGHRNLVWNYVKNMPGPLFWYYLPEHIALNIASVILFSLRGRSKVILKAKWDALKGLPRMMRKRKRIQAGRKIGVLELRSAMARGMPLRKFMDAAN